MLYLIGLGLTVNGISKQGLETLKRCKKIYLENYTVEFPYNTQGLVELLGRKKIHPAGRKFVESLKIVDEAKKLDVALLVYGSPLMATTHITILDEAKKSGVKTRVIHAGSVLDAVAETGLQIYKFGKIVSIPKYQENYSPDSFMEIIKENQSIGAHSLILVDIGLEFLEALSQLEKSADAHNVKLKKVIVCQRLGTNQSKIFYKRIEELKEYEDIRAPYCIIIPGKMHFLEKEFLEEF